MDTALNYEPFISEPLTWAEICQRYPDQWVCLVEIDIIEEQNFEFHSARVIGHGKTRREPFVQARPWRDKYDTIGHFYTGKIVAPVPRYFL